MMERDNRASENLGEIVIFNGEDGQVRVQVDADLAEKQEKGA